MKFSKLTVLSVFVNFIFAVFIIILLSYLLCITVYDVYVLPFGVMSNNNNNNNQGYWYLQTSEVIWLGYIRCGTA